MPIGGSRMHKSMEAGMLNMFKKYPEGQVGCSKMNEGKSRMSRKKELEKGVRSFSSL